MAGAQPPGLRPPTAAPRAGPVTVASGNRRHSRIRALPGCRHATLDLFRRRSADVAGIAFPKVRLALLGRSPVLRFNSLMTFRRLCLRWSAPETGRARACRRSGGKACSTDAGRSDNPRRVHSGGRPRKSRTAYCSGIAVSGTSGACAPSPCVAGPGAPGVSRRRAERRGESNTSRRRVRSPPRRR